MMKWNMITHIVDFMIEVGTQETSSGNYNFYFDELAEEQVEHFGISKEYALEWLNEHIDEITDEIDRREEVISETWYNYDECGNVEGFDINFALDYCPNIEEEVWENV